MHLMVFYILFLQNWICAWKDWWWLGSFVHLSIKFCLRIDVPGINFVEEEKKQHRIEYWRYHKKIVPNSINYLYNKFAFIALDSGQAIHMFRRIWFYLECGAICWNFMCDNYDRLQGAIHKWRPLWRGMGDAQYQKRWTMGRERSFIRLRYVPT